MTVLHHNVTAFTSEDGETYFLQPFEATLNRVEKLWAVVQKHAPLTSDFTRGDFDFFLGYVLSPGTVFISVFQQVDEKVEEVGVLYADTIVPGLYAKVHFIFWDLIMRGRQKVLFTALRGFMDDFKLHKVEIEVPINAYAALRRLRRMGLLPEGRRREATKQKGEWLDTLVFGVLDDDVTEEVVDVGAIPIDPANEDWYGMIQSDTKLGRFLMREE